MDLDEIKKIAELSRLSVPEEELSNVANGVSKMLSFVDTIKNVTIPKDINSKISETNVLRDDIVMPIESKHDLVDVAPMHQDHFVKVSKIIE